MTEPSDEQLDDVLVPGGDALVVAPPPPVPAPRVPHGTALVPARQAVAMAVTTFAAGALAAVVAHRRAARRPRGGGGLSLGRIVGSETFVVDVHRIRR